MLKEGDSKMISMFGEFDILAKKYRKNKMLYLKSKKIKKKRSRRISSSAVVFI